MKKTIIITEEQRDELVKMLVKEEIAKGIDKSILVKKFLDDNFKRASISEIGDDGYANDRPIVVYLDSYKQPLKKMSDEDLLDMLMDKFKTFSDDENERREFLLKIMKAWYNKDIKLDLGLI